MVKKGFSLIELLIVLVILGVLSAIAFPVYTGYIRSTARSEAKANLETLRLLEEQYFAERGCYYKPSGTCTNTTISGVTAIQGFLPGFQPGNEASLNFTYSIAITGTPAASGFTATATGKTGTKVEGDTLTIDNTNTKTGPW
ncbi:MAG: type IV pilin protein [Nitrospirota bacterium]